jgi:Rrf2 family protein
MRLSSLADYAVVVMCAAARQCGAPRANVAALSAETGVPQPTTEKLVRQLVHAGLLRSVRGPGGGVMLGRPAAAISLADIIEAIEGPIALTSCVDDARHECALEGNCRVQPHWGVVNSAVRGALAGVSLSSLLKPSPLQGDDATRPSPRRSAAGHRLGEGTERSAASVAPSLARLPLSPALSPNGEREQVSA